VLVAVVLAITAGLIAADFATWIELDVATIFGLPVVLAGATRSRAVLWMVTAVLVTATFVVYALQIPPGAFALNETFFVNRVLNTLSLFLLAGLLHIWMKSAEAREAQARVIKEQEEQLQAAKVSRRMVEVQEAERLEIANRLHDVVGQKLTALSLNLNIVKGQPLPSQVEQIGLRLDDSLKLVEETTASIRDVMAELRPAVLDDFGLAIALRWYADHFTKRSGVETSVIEQGARRRLSSTAEHALFRMAQNALANVAKHARADQVVGTLRTAARVSCLSVADNGEGFDPAALRQPAKDHGWGLMIMRERAAAIGARLTIESARSHGTKIVITLNEDSDDQSAAGG
jgi:signal transduction histidine kinase